MAKFAVICLVRANHYAINSTRFIKMFGSFSARLRPTFAIIGVRVVLFAGRSCTVGAKCPSATPGPAFSHQSPAGSAKSFHNPRAYERVFELSLPLWGEARLRTDRHI